MIDYEGAARYWEGRWSDEAAENYRLRERTRRMHNWVKQQANAERDPAKRAVLIEVANVLLKYKNGEFDE